MLLDDLEWELKSPRSLDMGCERTLLRGVEWMSSDGLADVVMMVLYVSRVSAAGKRRMEARMRGPIYPNAMVCVCRNRSLRGLLVRVIGYAQRV